MKKKVNKKKVIVVMLIIIVGIAVWALLKNIKKDENSNIIATKTIQDEHMQTIKYIIKTNGYYIENIIKEITFETEEEAKLEYNKYQTINEYEQRGIGLELKKKKLILTMPEKQFKLDINYKEYKDIRIITETGETKDIINQNYMKELLQEQGYEIK